MATYVEVQVPESRLAEVYRVLSESEASEPAPATEPEASFTPDRFWDREMVSEHLLGASENVRALARYLASRPGEEVTTDEAAVAIGVAGWYSVSWFILFLGRY